MEPTARLTGQVQGWGQRLTGEGVLSLFLGVRDVPQKELPVLDAGQLS